MKSKPTSLIKTILPWLLLLILIGAAYTMLNPSTSKTLTTSEYEALVNSGTKIEEAEITPSDLVISMTGVYKEDGKPVKFSVTLPNTETQMNELQTALAESGTLYTVRDASGDGMFMSVIMTFLPTILLIGVMFFMMTKIGGGGGNAKAFEFGNSRAKLEKDQKTRFTDVAGADEEKEELRELVEFLKNPKKFAAMGAKIPKGVLLVGPPGTGKTLLARAVSGEANVPFFSISGSEFVEMFVGVGAGRVRDMFKKAKENAPCIIFIDEIDAVGRQRGSGIGGGHDEREQTLNQLLVEMDGFAGNEGIIILAATNRADVLDPALLRPGRFDRQIQVANPDKRARAQILQVHARNKKFAADVNFDNIAARTPGFSGAELQNVLNEAALLAVRLGRDVITMDDIDEGIDRVIGGPAKKSRKYTEKERRLVAYHEAGHAIIGLTLEDANKVQKVTIIPRGNAGGYNLMTPKEETYFQTKTQLEASITGFMGGRVAEEIFFGDVSSGAQNDIEQATRLARLMVTELGMSELGPIKYGSGQDSVFLGRDYTSTNNDHSGQVAFEIDQQVRKIIDECYKECTRIITENKDKLELIAAALLEYETLANEQIEALYTTGKMPEVSGKTTNGTDVILPAEIRFNDQEEEKKAEESEPAPAEEPRVRKPVSYEDLDDLIDDMK
ncbi:ATP-dependent zinc metalloprotease FtsH [Beduini massiliensis]|uniref:ATP-dependent zinc metalloprotease FtsH n=1 Tax=Beduini massiliensis TaxID=1585974 RepID=UPI00059AA88B|nr:ATP-dependent zinc metalloprotease FtsH [Beduini massiliensis]